MDTSDCTFADEISASTLMDLLNFGIVCMQRKLRVVCLNEAARRQIGDIVGLRLMDGGRAFKNTPESRRLADAVERCMNAPAEHAVHEGICMHAVSTGEPVPILIRGTGSTAKRHATVILPLTGEPAESAGSLGRQWFGLTSREAEIAALLAQGLSTDQIGRKLQLRMSTVRTHIQHIYLKTGANSQPGLSRRLATIFLVA